MRFVEAQQPDEWTAYHEAGHCVIAVLLGGNVEWATIAPDKDDGPDRWGEVRVRWRDQPRWVSQALVYLAGPAAELVYREESLHPGLIAEFSSDWNAAWLVSQESRKSERDRLKLLEDIAAQLFQIFSKDNYWNATSDLADLLLAHEVIEGDEIQEAVSRWIT